MFRNVTGKGSSKLVAASAVAVLLQGCLTTEEQSETGATPPPAAVRLTGSVGDGPIVNSLIGVSSVGGALLEETTSNGRAEYEVLVAAAAGDYPLVIASDGGLDLVTDRGPDFDLFSVATTPGQSTTANINPISTFVLELASDLSGGLNNANVNSAIDIVDSGFDFGLVDLDTQGAMYAPIDGSNVTEVIRASEAMGEAVRRTRDRLVAAGNARSGDAVVQAVASDLIDGRIDGIGGPRTDARVSAVMTISVAEVLLETMQADLRVYGSPATTAMNDAAETVNGAVPSVLIEDLPVTAAMIRLASIGVDAGATVSTDSTLDAIASALDGVQDGMGASLVDSLIPNGYRGSMATLADFVASSDSSVVDAVNDVAGGRNVSTNNAPVISGTPTTTVVAGNSWSFQPSASDADQDALTFSVAGRPGWMSFNAASGRLDGTPSETDVGSYAGITVSVSDGSDTASLAPFTITVNSATSGNGTPTISGTPDTSVTAGNNYSFVPTASDPDGDSLSFSVSNLPSWASFNPNNGALSGTPGEQSVGTYPNVTITVSDGSASASLAPFDITVITAIVPNTPPTISGSPATVVTAETLYVFQPSANDDDGDTLSFSISGRPAWASFDTNTGRLSGTPSDADVGVYSNIVITVSDGEATTSLPAFGITVEALSLGSATLSWTPPTQYEDGSPLNDLAGFRVYWGTQPGVYTNSVTIDNPSVTTYVVEGLAPGTYEFTSTAFNSAGVESVFSNTASKTIQ